MKQPQKRAWTAVAFLLWIILVHAYTLAEVPPTQMLRGVVLLESDRQLFLKANDGSSCPITERHHSYSTGFFVDGSGLIETRWNDVEQYVNYLSGDSLSALLTQRLDSAKHRLVELQGFSDEMAYYKQNHTSHDPGYKDVLSLTNYIGHERDSISRLVKVLEKVLAGGGHEFVVSQRLVAYYRPTSSDHLQRYDAKEVDATHCCLTGKDTPKGAYVFNTTSLRWWNDERMLFGYLREPQNSSDLSNIIPECVKVDFSVDSLRFYPVLSGAPIVDTQGHLRVVCTSEGGENAGGFSLNPAAWWRSVRQTLSNLAVSSDNSLASAPRYGMVNVDVKNTTSFGTETRKAVFTGLISEGEPQYGRLDYEDGAYYYGYLRSGKRQGRGVYVSAAKHKFIGEWKGDTLERGERITKTGRFIGKFDGKLRPSGKGSLRGKDYYEGEWSEGKRVGFGIGLVPGRVVGYGNWKDDRYFGEPMLMHDDRVFGIDISRYDHEERGKIYPIQWDILRIVDLTDKYNQRVDGRTDFPVTFCYVKSTQGTNLVSRYTLSDATDARSHGVVVGHYHFFNPMSGRAQAKWFIDNTDVKPGDLPPMLDVEISKKQIQGMGGPKRMLEEMVEWIRVVKEKYHTQPMLYVNQSWVNSYMADAPDEVKKCPLWVARYSENQPYVHYDLWQFSDNIYLRGIEGRVDGNVFNGSKQKFERFVKEHCVK